MSIIYDKNITKLDQCFSTDDKGKITWFHEKFGSFLINKLNIYSKNDNIYIYKNGIYVRNELDILRAIQFYCKNAKENFRKEVLKYINIAAPVVEIKDNYNLIGCKNGVYDLSKNELLPFDKKYFLQHKINAEYNPDAKCEAVDKLLDKVSCNDKQIRLLLEEMIGYCLYRNCRYQKCFLLSGFGKNGKSTLLEMIINFIGEENTSALSLTDLQDKFKKAELQDKLVNINDDQSNEVITDTADFKKIVTGGIMTMERKNKDPFKYRNYAKLIMSANEIPKSKDKSDGYYRRFILVPLKAKIKNTDDDFDPNIADKVITDEAASYLLNLAISGLNRVINNGCFSENKLTAEEMNEYKEDNDPIIKFVNEYKIDNIVNNTTDYIYDEFNSWFEDEYNRKAKYNKTTITRSLKNNYEIDTIPKRVKNKVKRVYVLVDDNEQNEKEKSDKIVTLNSVLHFDKCNTDTENVENEPEELPF